MPQNQASYRGWQKLLSFALPLFVVLGLFGGTTAAMATANNNRSYVGLPQIRAALQGVPGLLSETDPHGDIKKALEQSRLPSVEPDQAYQAIQPGVVAYPANHVANVVQTTKGGGSRALTVIGDRKAPEEFAYKFDLTGSQYNQHTVSGNCIL